MRLRNTYLLLCCFLMCSYSSLSQTDIWRNILEEEINNTDGEKELFPKRAAYFDLKIRDLTNLLRTAPNESNTLINSSSSIIPVPFPDGAIVQFKIVKYDMLEEGLAEKYPNIQNFKGIAIDDPTTTIRFDWTNRGFRAMIRKDGASIFVDPYTRNTRRYYMSYFKKDYPSPRDFQCLFTGEDIEDSKSNQTEKVAGECRFKGYRLSVAVTAEYSNFFGATSAAQSSIVMDEVNTTINRINEVFERDLGIRLILIANTDDLFYYNASTDPYSNGNVSAMLSQNQSNTNSVIGSANYDIGHVFGTGSPNGIAGFGVVCNNSRKAEGATVRPTPSGDPFDIDYVAHEIGHQFRANHTQNNNCNRSSAASYEPGSASTIMGYAGICNPNVQNNSDAYFHAISLQEMGNYVTGSGFGNTCESTISTANTAPVVTDPGNFSIPRSTPFVLSTTASDADGDPITYCWEQWDPEVAAMPPQSTSTSGPLFRSLEPTTSSERHFINLTDLVANNDPTWEELPSVAREMEFRVTVRDNNATFGCTDEQNINVSVENSDPFVVLAPNTNVSLLGGQTFNVQWDEAQSPINCSTVDIALSTDGGLTYPTLLLAGTSNDGAADVTIPQLNTTTARIRVKCATGIFFDISNVNFEITASNPDYTLSANPTAAANCGANSVDYIITVGSLAGYTDAVTLSTTGLPMGAAASFSPNPVTPGNTSTLTVSNLNAVSEGSYNFNVEGNSTSGNKSIGLKLDI
ncbi:MAG: reprolysin-like metallopeptidase, partial [Bacteroidota bacterium]